MFSGYRADVPQLYVDIDRVRARQLGVSRMTLYRLMAKHGIGAGLRGSPDSVSG